MLIKNIYEYLAKPKKIIIASVFILLVSIFAFDRWLPYSLLSHYKYPVVIKPPILDKYGATAENFTFTTSNSSIGNQVKGESVDISGWFITAKTQSKSNTKSNTKSKKTIVILHTKGGTRQDTLEFGLPLWQAGFNLVAIDLRGHGSSGGQYFTFGYHEWQDVSNLVNYLESRGDGSASDITLIGISAGGAVAIRVASSLRLIASAQKDPRIKRLVTIASFADLGETIQQQVPWLPEFWRIRASHEAERIGQFKITAISPMQNIQNINCPVLIVHGKKDTYIPFTNGKKLFAMAPSPKDFYAVAEATHDNILQHNAEELRKKIINFMAN